jgi:hypothetical protein
VSDDFTVQWKSPSPGGSGRWRWRSLAVVVVLGLAGALTLVAARTTPIANGLGILPDQETVLNQSGLALETPQGAAAIAAHAAAQAATKQQSQAEVLSVVLETLVGAKGSKISPSGRLCWIVFLNPANDNVGNTPVPGQIQVDVVLVDAQSGAVIESFVSFSGTTPQSQVGSE